MTAITQLRRLPFRRALLRPLLLAGGERMLVLMNCIIMAMLILGVGLNEFTLVISIFLATIGQWCLVQTAKSDPQMSEVYLRHIKYQEFYSAQSSIHAKTAFIHPSLPI